MHPNELIAVEVVTFDEKAYEFYHSVDTIDENDNGDELAGSFIPVTTYNPTSNFNNGALGYFSVQSIKRYTMRITN